MANEVRITIGADTKAADKAVKSFRQKLDGMAGKAKVAGAALSVMGAGGVAAITGFAKAALVQKQAMDGLAAVMDTAGESFTEMEGKIMSTTAALQRKTNYGDEAQLRVLTTLVPVLGDVNLALDALPAIMNVAAATGKDFEAVAKLMGPVLAGATHNLADLGLKFEESQGPAERMEIIMGKVGGAAEATADPFKQMGNAMGDVKEVIGMHLLPLITPLISKIQVLAENAQAINPVFFKVVAIVLAAATAFGVIGGPILLLIGFLPVIIAGFAALSAAALPITLAILGIGAAIAAGILIWKNWGSIVSFFGNILGSVKDTFLSWKAAVVGAVSAVADVFINVGVAAFNKLQSVMASIGALYKTNWSWILPGGALINAVTLLVKYFKDDFIAILERIQKVVIRVGDAITEKFREIKNKVVDFASIIWKQWKANFEAIKSAFVTVWDVMTEAVKTAAAKIKSFIDPIVEVIKSLIGLWADSPLAKGISAVTGAIGRVGEFFGRERTFLGEGFAHGGIVPGPIGAPRIIQAHGGEMILNRGQQARSGVTINITGNNITGEIELDRLVRRAMAAAGTRGAI